MNDANADDHEDYYAQYVCFNLMLTQPFAEERREGVKFPLASETQNESCHENVARSDRRDMTLH